VGAAGGECGAGSADVAALTGAAYLAAEGFEQALAEELARRGVGVSGWHGGLALSPDAPVAAAWAQNVWLAPREIEVASIGAAVAALRGVQRNWAAYEVPGVRRRMALITARLPRLRPKPLVFPCAAPAGHLGAWSLLTPERMLASATQSSPFVNGAVGFVEDREGPPSRAYLKLWEALTVFGEWPAPGTKCFDLGAAPGGWTWALARLGAVVVAVDKAKLDASVAAMWGVESRVESAFGLDPAGQGAEWLFSDVIAYPARLLGLVRQWIDAGEVRRIVCTLKFQGATDHEAAEAFAAIPGVQVVHLFHNKHELTFFWRRPEEPAPPRAN
jgi:23S rRNA (cytidine2498-2'-O)-methyltransferase